MGTDLSVGDYVDGVPYLEMRLRMLLTGSADPSDGDWARALRRLLDELPALRRAGAKLAALEAGGVDNWEGYDYAMSELYEEDE